MLLRFYVPNLEGGPPGKGYIQLLEAGLEAHTLCSPLPCSVDWQLAGAEHAMLFPELSKGVSRSLAVLRDVSKGLLSSFVSHTTDILTSQFMMKRCTAGTWKPNSFSPLHSQRCPMRPHVHISLLGLLSWFSHLQP